MTVKEAINTRYSTRNYCENQEISQEKMDLILDAGRFAPNGLSVEPWKFYLIQGDMQKLQAACYGQEHVGAAGFAIALVNYKQEMIDKNPNILIDKFKNSGFSDEKINAYMQMLSQKGTQYYREQLMFAAGQMCLQATELEIGSVIMGGFEKDKVANLINLDQENYEVGLVISFGLNADLEPKQRIRRPREEVVNYTQI